MNLIASEVSVDTLPSGLLVDLPVVLGEFGGLSITSTPITRANSGFPRSRPQRA